MFLGVWWALSGKPKLGLREELLSAVENNPESTCCIRVQSRVVMVRPARRRCAGYGAIALFCARRRWRGLALPAAPRRPPRRRRPGVNWQREMAVISRSGARAPRAVDYDCLLADVIQRA